MFELRLFRANPCARLPGATQLPPATRGQFMVFCLCMAVIGTRAFSSGDASRKNSGAECGKLIGFAMGCRVNLKFSRVGVGPSFLFSFAQRNKIFASVAAGRKVNKLLNKFEQLGAEKEMVGATGFEPATSCSQSKCSTRLSYAPTSAAMITGTAGSATKFAGNGT